MVTCDHSHNSSYADDLRWLLRSHRPSPREGEEWRQRLALYFRTFVLCDFHQFVCITGVSSYNVDLTKQEVIVKGAIPYDDLLAIIKKTGKEASFYLIIMISIAHKILH